MDPSEANSGETSSSREATKLLALWLRRRSTLTMAAPAPPTYSVRSTVATPVLLNLAPLSNALSFQIGGDSPASLAGEVQVKFMSSDEEQQRPVCARLEVNFVGVETRDGERIELCEHREVLWGLGVPSSSTHQGTGSFPPPTSPFKIALTRELPHCIHLGDSSLEYTLSATLHFADSTVPPLTKSIPVHLVRLSPPGAVFNSPSLSSATPASMMRPSTLTVDEPVRTSVRLRRTVFKRSEPIALLVRIEVPSAHAVQDDGLRLRNISAELVRTVARAKSSSKPAELVEAMSVDAITELAAPSQPPAPPHTTILAHSGKSCRFSPSRPIVLRLLLHPPVVVACESVTQSSVLHDISFAVNVTVALSSSRTPRASITIAHPVFIVPDSLSTVKSEKQREVDGEGTGWEDEVATGQVPTYHESTDEPSGSTAWSNGGTAHAPPGLGSDDDSEEEEFDGYEELSASLSSDAPPPPITEDVSPPGAGGGYLALHEAVVALPPQQIAIPASVAATGVQAFDLLNLPRFSPSSEGDSTTTRGTTSPLPPPFDHSTPPPYFGDTPLQAPVVQPAPSGPPPYTSTPR